MRLEEDPLNTLPSSASEFNGDLYVSLQDTADKLKSLRDRLKVKLHLVGMEAKDIKTDLEDSVDGLSRRLSDYAGTLEKTKESAEVQLHLGLMDAKKHWDITKENAEEVLGLMKEDKEKAKAFLQEMQLQAKLAQNEAKDSLHKTKEELSENFKEISKQGVIALKKMNHSIADLLQKLT
jgi:hypothetical protein